MTKIIQTRVDANGDVHVDFSGFPGGECIAEEERIRRELVMLGLSWKATRCARKSNETEDANSNARTISQ